MSYFQLWQCPQQLIHCLWKITISVYVLSKWYMINWLYSRCVTDAPVSLLVSIDSIREVCEGKQSEIFQRYSEGSFDPNCCFSLYYGEHMESLDLVSGTGEEARTWITGLKYLMAGISDEDSLAKRQRTRDQYPSPLFNRLHFPCLNDCLFI